MIADVYFDNEHVLSSVEPDRVPREGDEVYTSEGDYYKVASVARLWVTPHRRFGSRVEIRLTKIRKGR
jgi:hypothetical protein